MEPKYEFLLGSQYLTQFYGRILFGKFTEEILLFPELSGKALLQNMYCASCNSFPLDLDKFRRQAVASGEVLCQTVNGRSWYVWNTFEHNVSRARKEKQELSSHRQKLKKEEFDLLLDQNSKFINSLPSDIYVEFH